MLKVVDIGIFEPVVEYGDMMQGISSDHANYLGSTGTLSHEGADGSSSGDRIKSVVECNL